MKMKIKNKSTNYHTSVYIVLDTPKETTGCRGCNLGIKVYPYIIIGILIAYSFKNNTFPLSIYYIEYRHLERSDKR